MPEAARTTAGTIPSDTGRPGRRREVAAMGPKEAVWLARYMCILSLAFAALGLLLLVLVRRPRFGRATFFRRFFGFERFRERFREHRPLECP